MGQTASYVPKVVEIKKDGNMYTLIVGYVSPTTLWNVSEDGSAESVPDKYLYYDLEKIGNGNFIIKAVRRIPEDELPDDLEVSDMQSLNQTQYFDYDEIQQEYMEQEEDVLSYALFEQVALKFFEYRKAKKYGLDADNADAALGIHNA